MEEWGPSVPAPPGPASESWRLSAASQGPEQRGSLSTSPWSTAQVGKTMGKAKNQSHLPAPRQGHQPEAGRGAWVSLEVLGEPRKSSSKPKLGINFNGYL